MNERDAVIESLLAEAMTTAEELRRKLEIETRFIEALQDRRGSGTNGHAATVGNERPLEPKHKPAGSATIPDQAAAVLRTAGGAMRATDVALAMLPVGVTAAESFKIKKNVISALNRRTDLFEKVGRGMFRIKGNT